MEYKSRRGGFARANSIRRASTKKVSFDVESEEMETKFLYRAPKPRRTNSNRVSVDLVDINEMENRVRQKLIRSTTVSVPVEVMDFGNTIATRIEKIKFGIKQATRINLKWTQKVGHHWKFYGLVPGDNPRWKIRPLMIILYLLLTTTKTTVGTILGMIKFRYGAFYLGDILGFVASSQLLALYVKIPDIMVNGYGLVVYSLALFGKNDLRWFEALTELRDLRGNPYITEKYAGKLAKTTAVVCKVVSQIAPIYIASYTTLASLPYFLHLNVWQFFTLGLFYSGMYYGYLLVSAQIIIMQGCYFLLLCLYASYTLASVCEKIAPIITSTRGKWGPRTLEFQFKSINRSLSLIQSCNNYFAQKLKPLFGFNLSVLLFFTFALDKTQSFLEVAALLAAILFCFECTAFFCFSASLFKVRMQRTFVKLNSLQTSKALSFRQKWALLLILEMIASKKKRIGFQIKNWFNLNNFLFLKIMFSLSSLYLLLVKFQRRFKKNEVSFAALL